MKRLLYYLNLITDNSTTTFRYTDTVDGKPVQREIYDGECDVVYLKPSGEILNSERMGSRREPSYWRDDISYTFERTNRMALDLPTITIAIPILRLGITKTTPAAADFCLREIAPYFETINGDYANKARPDRDNGKFYIYKPGGEVLVRNAAYFGMRPAKTYENGRKSVIFETKFVDLPPDRMCLCVRIEVQLPHGKLGRMRKMLTGNLPDAVEKFVKEFNIEGLRVAIELETRQNYIRSFLRDNDYCAFVANGSILPREKNTILPMKNALPFQSTPEDEIEIAGVRGMGIKNGVTVITGGGYSGKSTVLDAISAGIYNHVEGDGRELCITDDSAVTITAEDGRAVSCLNVSPFIKWIPGGNVHEFTTTRASGSTSQAANIIEAIDCGVTLLLIDEDRSATNFMIRDHLMRELIKKEPITPFTDRVRELASNGISTILVIGGSGEYLSVADKVYLMDDFMISDITVQAKHLAPAPSTQPVSADWVTRRVLLNGRFTSYPHGSGTERLEVSDTGFIIFGDERIDIRTIHNIVTPSQANAIAFMLRHLACSTDGDHGLKNLMAALRDIEHKADTCEINIMTHVQRMFEQIRLNGLDIVNTGFFTTMNRFLDMPRKIELCAAINRMRHIVWSLSQP